MNDKLPPPRQSCSVFANDDAFVIFCSNQEKSWILKDAKPFVKVNRDADPELLGALIMQVLQRSRQGLENTPPESLQSPALKSQFRFAGYPNWSRFQYANDSVSVSYDFSRVHFHPYCKDKYYYSEVSTSLSCEYEAKSIGDTLLQALELIESA